MLERILEFTRCIFEEMDPAAFQKRFLEALLEIQNVERRLPMGEERGSASCASRPQDPERAHPGPGDPRGQAPAWPAGSWPTRP